MRNLRDWFSVILFFFIALFHHTVLAQNGIPLDELEPASGIDFVIFTDINGVCYYKSASAVLLSEFQNDLPAATTYIFDAPLETTSNPSGSEVTVSINPTTSDNQTITRFERSGTKIYLEIENDPNEYLLSLPVDNVGTDDQEITNFAVYNGDLVIELESDANGQWAIPLTDIVDLTGYVELSATTNWDKDVSDDLTSSDVQTLIDASQASLNYWTKTGANVHYTGNVGINTSSPTELLHAVSTSALGRIFSENTSPTGIGALQAQNDDGTYVSLRAYGSSHTGALFGQSTADNMYLFSSGNDLTVGTLAAHNLYFGTSNIRSFVVQPDRDVHFYQQVGIGADATGPERLRVNGSINALDARSSIVLNNRGLGGFYNFYGGINAGSENSGSNYNMALGRSALQALAGGDANVGIGYQAGLRCTTGSSNFFLGASAGIDATTADGCIYLGASAGAGNNTDDRFFLSGVGTHLSPLMYGEFENRYLRIKSHLAISNQNNNTDLASITTEYNGVEWEFEHDEFNDLNLTTEGSGSFYLQAPLKMLESTLTPSTTNLTFAVWQTNTSGVNHVVKQAQLGDNMFVSGDEINSKFIEPYPASYSVSTVTFTSSEVTLDLAEDLDPVNNCTDLGTDAIQVDASGTYFYTVTVNGQVPSDGDGFYIKIDQEGTTLQDRKFLGFAGGFTNSLSGYFVRTSTSNDEISIKARRASTEAVTILNDVTIQMHRVGVSG